MQRSLTRKSGVETDLCIKISQKFGAEWINEFSKENQVNLKYFRFSSMNEANELWMGEQHSTGKTIITLYRLFQHA